MCDKLINHGQNKKQTDAIEKGLSQNRSTITAKQEQATQKKVWKAKRVINISRNQMPNLQGHG